MLGSLLLDDVTNDLFLLDDVTNNLLLLDGITGVSVVETAIVKFKNVRLVASYTTSVLAIPETLAYLNDLP